MDGALGFEQRKARSPPSSRWSRSSRLSRVSVARGGLPRTQSTRYFEPVALSFPCQRALISQCSQCSSYPGTSKSGTVGARLRSPASSQPGRLLRLPSRPGPWGQEQEKRSRPTRRASQRGHPVSSESEFRHGGPLQEMPALLRGWRSGGSPGAADLPDSFAPEAILVPRAERQ